jgi:hypothetical protein
VPDCPECGRHVGILLEDGWCIWCDQEHDRIARYRARARRPDPFDLDPAEPPESETERYNHEQST